MNISEQGLKLLRDYYMREYEDTPEDAFKWFMGTDLDLLVVGISILIKYQQYKALIEDYKEKYELD